MVVLVISANHREHHREHRVQQHIPGSHEHREHRVLSADACVRYRDAAHVDAALRGDVPLSSVPASLSPGKEIHDAMLSAARAIYVYVDLGVDPSVADLVAQTDKPVTFRSLREWAWPHIRVVDEGRGVEIDIIAPSTPDGISRDVAKPSFKVVSTYTLESQQRPPSQLPETRIVQAQPAAPARRRRRKGR